MSHPKSHTEAIQQNLDPAAERITPGGVEWRYFDNEEKDKK